MHTGRTVRTGTYAYAAWPRRASCSAPDRLDACNVYYNAALVSTHSPWPVKGHSHRISYAGHFSTDGRTASVSHAGEAEGS